MNTLKSSKKRGRPPEFDHEEALEKALRVFWAHGYEGASMAEITHAMNINKPSLYAAFGNKEELFRKALGKYLAGPVSYVGDAMHEPTARQVVERFLTKSAAFLTNPDYPRGCMIAMGTLACGEESKTIQQLLIAYRKGYEAALTRRFELAREQSDLPQGANPKELAKYVATIHQGMSVQAINGATQDELMSVIKLVLNSWPTGT